MLAGAIPKARPAVRFHMGAFEEVQWWQPLNYAVAIQCSVTSW